MLFWDTQKVMASLYYQFTRPVCQQFELTQIELDILLFLTNYPQYDTAADITRVRRLTKSHVSAALKRLEERGMVKKRHQEGNRKLLHLQITQAADRVIAAGREAQRDFARQLFAGFSQEEFELCRRCFVRINENARSGLMEATDKENATA